MMSKHQELKNNFKKDIKAAPQLTTSISLQSGSVPIDLQIVEISLEHKTVLVSRANLPLLGDNDKLPIYDILILITHLCLYYFFFF